MKIKKGKENKMVKISVIIPVYNGEKYLKECLNSVVEQTLDGIEIICVNDGSTDSTKEILEEYALNYKNIKVINQKNSGVIGARITGLKHSAGKYIGWVDADDFIEKTMYEKLYNEIEKDNSDIAICNYNFYPKEVVNKEKWYKDYKGKVDWKFISRNTVQWNKIVRKELLDDINAVDLFKEVGEECYSFVLIAASKIVTISEPLYNYRVGHSSLSSNFKNIKWYINTVERWDKTVRYVENDNKLGSDWIEFYNYMRLYYYLVLLIVTCVNNDRQKYNEVRIFLKKNKLFSKKYNKYLNEYLSFYKKIFLKYIGMNSFYLTRVACKLILK